MINKKVFVTQKLARRLLISLAAGWVGIVLFFFAYWVKLLFNNRHQAFVPNHDKRVAMFRFSTRNPRSEGTWIF